MTDSGFEIPSTQSEQTVINPASLASNEPQLLSLFRASGLTGPLPVIAKSSHLLLEIINDWKREHPGQKVPGSILKTYKVGPRMHNFAGGSTQVLHDRLEISRLHVVRIAKGSDESSMLLIPHTKNTCAWMGYHAWLGGELGFTEYTILHKIDRESYEKQLLEKSQKPGTTTPYIDLNSMTSSDISSDKSSDEALAQYSGLSQKRKRYETRSSQREYQQTGLKLYSFPSSAPKLRLKLPSLKRSALNVSSSWRVAQSTPQAGIVPPQTPQHPISPFALPPTPPTPPTPSTPSTPSSNNTVRFYFFMAANSLGAIPKPLDQCSTPSAFFDEALVAFTIVGKVPAYPQIAGVKVVIKPSAERTIFVPWRNRESYYEMMDIVKENAAGRTGRLDVEVTCVDGGR